MSEFAKTLETFVRTSSPHKPVDAAVGVSLDLSQPAQLRAALTSVELLRGLGPEILDAVVARCPLRRLAKGEPLLVAGQTNSEIFLVLEGELGVHLDDKLEARVATLRAGDTVGELSAIDKKPTSATVIAHQPAALLVIDETMFWHVIQASHSFAVRLMLKLVERLRANNTAVQANMELASHFEAAALADALTGVHSRRWLDETLPRLCDRHRFDGVPLTIGVVDVDFFKKVNDTYGHQTGDMVLVGVAGMLRGKLRPTDYVARFGGEEFVLIFPQTPLAGARVAAERLREAMRDAALKSRDGKPLPRVTISIGLATLAPDQDVASLLEAADSCLYRAKHNGRDRVES
ncbi:MAG TPA: GGDEF domain-containing protein [Polyangiales bacterium]|nr:GGDEF domain-containing protein [Polyangiales bacterium]